MRYVTQFASLFVFNYLITYRLGKLVQFFLKGFSRACTLKLVQLSFLAFFVHCKLLNRGNYRRKKGCAIIQSDCQKQQKHKRRAH